MISGSGFSCLRNDLRLPNSFEWPVACDVEAYPALLQGAACIPEPLGSFRSVSTACHSAIWDETFTFKDTFAALGNAIQLQGEVLLDCMNFPSHLPQCPDSSLQLRSCLKQAMHSKRNAVKVHFDDEVDWPTLDRTVVEPPRVLIADCPSHVVCHFPSAENPLSDPLSCQAVLIPGGSPTHEFCRTEATDIFTDSLFFNIGPLHVPLHVPQRTAAPLPFVVELIGLPGLRALPTNTFHQHGFVIRTWYVHHEHVRHWRVPRMIEIRTAWSMWHQQILHCWRDMIDPDSAVSFHVVLPDPPRDYLSRQIVADLIVAQGDGRFACLLTLQSFRSPRGPLALALSLQGAVTGEDIAVVAGIDHLCVQHSCRFSCGHDPIPIAADPPFLVRNGLSLQVNIQQTLHDDLPLSN